MRLTPTDHTEHIQTPFYLLDERHLRDNLTLIRQVAQDAGVEIILAFKAFALWRTFPIFREYISSTTASSVNEALLAWREFGARAHTYSPAYEERDFETIMTCSSHITFNSLTQYERFGERVKHHNDTGHHRISCGLRINPEYSEIEVALYNPCAPGSRFGVLAENLPDSLPKGIEGFHCHNHCESSAQAFAHSIAKLEDKFGPWLPQIKWINFGGGHLMTQDGYDTALLINTLKAFKSRHPHLSIVLEPGSAFAWQTGALVAEVVDVVENHGIRTAIVNASFTAHMPDCLEMPYHPYIQGAKTVPCDLNAAPQPTSPNTYRIGGNSCLSGDVMGNWTFEKPLQIGDRIVFEDMIHYTTVKTTLFNGIRHPSIAMRHMDKSVTILKQYGYEDYRDRMC